MLLALKLFIINADPPLTDINPFDLIFLASTSVNVTCAPIYALTKSSMFSITVFLISKVPG